MEKEKRQAGITGSTLIDKIYFVYKKDCVFRSLFYMFYLSLLFLDVNHTSAIGAFDLQIVARLGYAAAVGALDGVYAQIVGAIVEGDYLCILNGIACEILLVYAHAHGVLYVFGLHGEVVCNLAYIAEALALDCVDDARIFFLRTVFYPCYRRAVKAEHRKRNAYAEHNFIYDVCVHVDCSDYYKNYAHGQTQREQN